MLEHDQLLLEAASTCLYIDVSTTQMLLNQITNPRSPDSKCPAGKRHTSNAMTKKCKATLGIISGMQNLNMKLFTVKAQSRSEKHKSSKGNALFHIILILY